MKQALYERSPASLSPPATAIAAPSAERRVDDGHGCVTEPFLRLEWTGRGGREPRTFEADVVINCSGPNGDITATRDPLLCDLVAQGLIRPDACRLGMDVDARGRLIDANGASARTLFAVGPMTRGASWEITSVPDIRVQAAACAGHVDRAIAARAFA